MNAIEASIARITVDLTAHGRPWALVGGLAVSARTEPRTTRDVDVAVDVRDDADAESLVHALLRSGYVVHAAIEQVSTGRLATMRLLPRRPQDAIDLKALLDEATAHDLDVARAAVDLIVERGFGRGRDLVGLLADAVARRPR